VFHLRPPLKGFGIDAHADGPRPRLSDMVKLAAILDDLMVIDAKNGTRPEKLNNPSDQLPASLDQIGLETIRRIDRDVRQIAGIASVTISYNISGSTDSSAV